MPEANVASIVERRFAATPRMSEPERLHWGCVFSLIQSKPQKIIGNADVGDLQERADHVRDVLAAIAEYIGAIAADTAREMPDADIDKKYVKGMLEDTASDIVAHLVRKVDELGGAHGRSRPYSLIATMETAR